jgi:hypothetical protein
MAREAFGLGAGLGWESTSFLLNLSHTIRGPKGRIR